MADLVIILHTPGGTCSYNALLATVAGSLAALRRALLGQEVMGRELEAVAAAITLNKVSLRSSLLIQVLKCIALVCSRAGAAADGCK